MRVLIACFFGILIALQCDAQSAKVFKIQEDEIRNYMQTISRQLGVSCSTCHKTDNFKNPDKREYKVSKEHIKLTQILIDNGMDGKKGPKADCYMCHRGKLKPDYQEKLHPMTK